MSDNRTPSWRHVRRQFLFALALSLFALFIFSIFSLSPNEGFRSAELQFTDASAGGLAIVPASCPSFPHTNGACGVVATGDGCTIGAGPATSEDGGQLGGGTQGQLSLSWNVISIGQEAGDSGGFNGFTSFFTSYSGSINNGIGSVPQSGSTPIAPLVTTTYTFSGTVSVFFVPLQNFSCSVTVVPGQVPPPAATTDEGAGGSCVSGYSCSGNDLYYQAQCRGRGQLIQTCAYGCSGGACLVPPPPSGSIRAVPALVRNGDKVQVTWSAANVSSCTVSGSNSDSWSGASGSQLSAAIVAQTTYTLSCTGLDGSTFVQSAVVNIIPIFQET